MSTETNKQLLKKWEDFHRNLLKSNTVDINETAAERLNRKADLEKDYEAWFKYYFKEYYKSEPAAFHKKATKRFIEKKRWFEQRRWSRELAKSTRTMMEVLYLVLVKKELKMTILASANLESAERLLLPYKINLEANDRIINDYGVQKNLGNWTSTHFTTNSGSSFLGIGAGQSPRGTRNEAYRVDCLLIDDIDTDEECRNERIIKEKVKWIQEALIPTMSVSGSYRILMCGNLISKNSTIALLEKNCHHVDTVNIRDKNGKSSWPEKNSEKDIDEFLSMFSYASIQKEFFNNPVTEGTVFKQMNYKKIRPLKDYKYLVCYTDPSFKSSKKNDYKATVLVGKWNDEFHIIKAFCDQTTTAQMVEWHYQINEYVRDRVPVYYYMESNFIQDTLLDEFYNEGTKRGKVIPIKGDDRSKGDKFSRIESLLEPLNRNLKLWLNAAEKDNPHMETLKEQFLSLEPGSSAHDDAPDATEGAVFILNVSERKRNTNSRTQQRTNRKY